MDKEESSFGPIRSILWPIHRSETKKVLSMLFLFFLLCISYSLLRNLKDTVILTANSSGAAVLPFLKVYGMLPAVFIAAFIYTKLCSKFRREKVFYIVISSFLTYFLTFAFVLYPLGDLLHLSSLETFLTNYLPAGFNGLIGMVCNWSYSLFYVLAELWSVMVLAVLFWGFANDVTSVQEAKRTYGILNIGSNIAPTLGGIVGLIALSNVSLSAAEVPGDAFGQTLVKTILIIACLGSLAMATFYWIQKNVLTKPLSEVTGGGKKKSRLSIRASIRYLLKSRYLCCIAMIVLGYNISINLTDILWKQQLKAHFSDPNEMLAHMYWITIWIGVIATQGSLLFSFIVRRFGWTFVAVLTPLVMTAMAIGFFAFMFCGDALSSISLTLFGLTPTAMTVYFGSTQNCLSKSGKYSIFDSTKELAFLPLDPESRLRGKAAIDGLGSGVGKSGASFLYQGLIISTGSVLAATPFVAVILFVAFTSWIYSAFSLGKQFKQKTAEDTAVSVEPAEAEPQET